MGPVLQDERVEYMIVISCTCLDFRGEMGNDKNTLFLFFDKQIKK